MTNIALSSWHNEAEQNGRHLACEILLNENCCTVIQIFKLFAKVYDISPFVQWMARNRRQAIIWTNDGLVDWRIYLSTSLNLLSHCCYPTGLHISPSWSADKKSDTADLSQDFMPDLENIPNETIYYGCTYESKYKYF